MAWKGGIHVKRVMTWIFVLVILLASAGCDGRSMNDIIENEPSITGIVEEVREQSFLIYLETDGYPDGALFEISLNVENEDSYTDVSVGDEVVVYFDGNIAESYPMQILKVYGITLKTPANRES